MGKYTNSSGKTGTSQSFIDTDLDGVVDKETITSLNIVDTKSPKITLKTIILIIISVLLTVIAGFIPAKIASKKDPVEALRTE